MNGDAGPALELDGLGKSYPTGHIIRRRREALSGLSLSVNRGEIFGYLGPNGSGKTTTLKVLFGIVAPDTGRVSVLGYPHADPRWRGRAGYLPEHPYFYDYLTPAEYLDYAARLFGIGRAERRERTRALLAQVGLERVADVPLRRFSKGMLQRLGLAQALVNDPEIVFLDEPMSGLDPLGRRLVRDVILSLRARGQTVFFSTHILPDAEALCDRVAVLRAGRLLSAGRLDEILSVEVAHVEVLVGGGDPVAAGALPSGVLACQTLGERVRLEVEERDLLPVLGWARDGGRRILLVQPVRQSLEDYFFRELGSEGGASWTPQD